MSFSPSHTNQLRLLTRLSKNNCQFKSNIIPFRAGNKKICLVFSCDARLLSYIRDMRFVLMHFCQGKTAGDLENSSQSFVRSRSYGFARVSSYKTSVNIEMISELGALSMSALYVSIIHNYSYLMFLDSWARERSSAQPSCPRRSCKRFVYNL